MAAARQCSKCKQFYEVENKNNTVIRMYDQVTITKHSEQYRPNFPKEYDLCPRCSDLFITWVNNEVKENENDQN